MSLENLSIPVKITYIISINSFWVVENDSKTSKNRFFITNKEKAKILIKKKAIPEINKIVLYKNEDLHQRARIEKITNSQIKIFLLDHGKYVNASEEDLIEISDHWSKIPYLAVKVELNSFSGENTKESFAVLHALISSSEKIFLHPVRFEHEILIADILLIINGEEINILPKINDEESLININRSLKSLHSLLDDQRQEGSIASGSGLALIAKSMSLRDKQQPILQERPNDTSKEKSSPKESPAPMDQGINFGGPHSVYVYTNTPLRPITALTLSELSTSILDARLIDSLVNQLNLTAPTELQAWIWPAIATGHNSIIAMEPLGNGITLGWLAPVINLVLEDQISIQVPKGNAPLVLVLVPNWQDGIFCESLAKQLIPDDANCEIMLIHGLGREEEKLWDLINGVEILISTPPCFLRLMNESRFITSCSRLLTLVLQHSDQLLDLFPNEIDTIVRKSLQSAQSRNLPVQLVTTTQIWKHEILTLAKRFASRPTIMITSPLEALGAAKVPVTLHISKKSILPKLQGRCFISCDNYKEALYFANILKGLNGEVFVAHENCPNNHFEHIQRMWKRSLLIKKGLPLVLICTDKVAHNINIRDATRLFHLSLPEDKVHFEMRFLCLYNNLNLYSYEKKSLEVHIIIEKSKPKWFSSYLKILKCIKEERPQRTDGELCTSLESFGICRTINSTCTKRHTLSLLDQPLENGPQFGDFISFHLLSIMDASRYRCRILSLRSKNGGVRKNVENEFLKIYFFLKEYCDIELIKGSRRKLSWNLGDLCVVNTAKRGKILALDQEQSMARILYLDEARIENVKLKNLLPLPDDIPNIFPLAYQVVLCDIEPRDKASLWSIEAISYMNSLLFATNKKSVHLRGHVRLVLGHTIWIQNLYVEEYNESSKIKYVSFKPRAKLIEKKIAVEAPEATAKIEQLASKLKSIEATLQELTLADEVKDEKQKPQDSSTNTLQDTTLINKRENLEKQETEKNKEIQNISLIKPPKATTKDEIQKKEEKLDQHPIPNNNNNNNNSVQVASSDGQVVYDLLIDDIFEFINAASQGTVNRQTLLSQYGGSLEECERNNEDFNRSQENNINLYCDESIDAEFTSLSPPITKPKKDTETNYKLLMVRKFKQERAISLAKIQRPSRISIPAKLPFNYKPLISWAQDLFYVYLKLFEEDIDRNGFYMRSFAQHLDLVSTKKSIRLDLFGPIKQIEHRVTGRYIQVKLRKMVIGFTWPSLIYNKEAESSGLIRVDYELVCSQIPDEQAQLSEANELLLSASMVTGSSAVSALESVGLEMPQPDPGSSSDDSDEENFSFQN